MCRSVCLYLIVSHVENMCRKSPRGLFHKQIVHVLLILTFYSSYWVLSTATGTETFAIHQNNGSYRLYGFKWFSSAIDADMALTLARPVDAETGHLHVVEVTLVLVSYLPLSFRRLLF